jgi:alpha-amylase/alpha-mannosidase (GH57 family)
VGIRQRVASDPCAVVSIVIDSGDTWDRYPDNGYAFLQCLYRRLTHHPVLQLTTFSRYLNAGNGQLQPLKFHNWPGAIGSRPIGGINNYRAWEMLIEARQHLDRAMEHKRLNCHQQQSACRQLAICEGSDWFIRPENEQLPKTATLYDKLYRMHLVTLYRKLGESPPDYLGRPFH